MTLNRKNMDAPKIEPMLFNNVCQSKVIDIKNNVDESFCFLESDYQINFKMI